MHKSKLFILACLFLPLTILLGAAGPQVTIKEFDVPTPNSRPHDPAVAPDGSLWYTGQKANKLGRLDPATGKIKEFSLKTPDSGPHGLVADSQGIFGSQQLARDISESWTRTLATSPNTTCPRDRKQIRTRRYSISKEFCGSRPKSRIFWDVLIRRRERSS